MTNAHLPVPRFAGALLVFGAVGFIVVFSFLAAAFGYPDVLDRPAAEVLPALVGGGARMRVAWTVYAVLAATIAVAALSIHDVLPFAPRWNRLVTLSGVVAGAAMTAGLARWPTLQWTLGQHWLATRDASVHAALRADFDALNVALGNVVGEFIGELGLASWAAGIGVASRRTWIGRATLALSAFMYVGAFRNVLPVTRLATEVTNVLLPAVMIALGVVWAWRGPGAARSVRETRPGSLPSSA